MNLNRTINLNKKFIVLLFLVNIVALCLYYSYALFQVTVIQNNAVVLSTSTVNLTLSTNVTNNSFSLSSGETTVNITLNSTNTSALGYKMYYTSSTGNESLQVTSATEFNNYVVEGTMTSSKTFSLTFKNNGGDSVITLGAIGGVVGVPIVLQSGQHEIRLTKFVSDSCYTATVDTSTNEATIIDYNVNSCGTTANIPSSIDDNTVTAIGNSAFNDMSLLSVSIPNAVETIGDYAFAYNDITSISIPNSVVTIGDSAFLENNINNLTIGSSVETIDSNAFSKNKLVSLTIPDSVTNILSNAFNYNLLSSLNLGNNIEYIDDRAFYDDEDDGTNSYTERAYGPNHLSTVEIPASYLDNGCDAVGFAFPSNVTLTYNSQDIKTSYCQ